MSMRMAAGAVILASLIAGSVGAEEPQAVKIPDQAVSLRAWQPPDLDDVIWGGEYSGVKFYAVPDPSIPLPPEYRPEALLAKLDPSLTVESVGSPPFSGPKTREEILSALPNTAFRLTSLISPEGTRAVTLGTPAVVVYVTGYKTNPAYAATLEDVLSGRYLEDKRVYISGFHVRIGDLPPCHVTYGNLCGRPN